MHMCYYQNDEINQHVFQSILDSVGEGIFLLDTEGSILFCNKNAMNILMLPKTKITGNFFHSFIAEEDSGLFEAFLKRKSGLETKNIEISICTTESVRIPVEITVEIIERGKDKNILLIIKTLKREDEQCAISSQKLSRAILEQAGEAIFVCDENGVVIRASWPSYDLCGKNPLLQPFKENVFLSFKENDARVELSPVLQGTYISQKEVYMYQENETRSFLFHARPRINAFNKVTGCVVTLTEITQQKQIEDDLRKERDKAQSYLDIANVIIMALDNNHNITLMNKKGGEIIGEIPQEMIGKNWLDCYTLPEERLSVKEHFDSLIANGQSDHKYSEYFILTRHGEVRLIAWDSTVVKNEKGEISGTLSSGEDITAKRKAELAREHFFSKVRQLSNENQKRADEFDTIFSSLVDPILIFDKDGKITKASESAISFLKFDPIHMDYTFFMHKTREFTQGGTPMLPELITDSLKGLKRQEIFSFNSIVGDEIVVHCFTSPIISQMTVAGIVLAWHDITERKRSERLLKKSHNELELLVAERTNELLEANKKLQIEIQERKEIEAKIQESNELLEKIFANTQFSVAYLDTLFNYIRVNSAYAEAEGQKPDYYPGKNHFDLHPNNEDKEIFLSVLKNRKPYNCFAKPFTYKKGVEKKSFWDWSLQPTFSSKKEVEGFLYCLINVTERVKAEENLKKTLEELNQAKRLTDIGTLAATVAHELRNPLGVIRTATFNMKRKNKDTRLSRHLANIDKKISESDQIINNLLFYSRLKIPHLETIQIFDILDECVYSIQKQFYKHKVLIDQQFLPLKNVWIDADPYQIREIFNNILSNAYQAFPDGKGTIQIKSYLTRTNKLDIEIIDNGTGIEKEDLPRIFEPFFTKKSKGTGLGLSICNELMHLHGGDISIESEKNIGTKVHISFPLERNEK